MFRLPKYNGVPKLQLSDLSNQSNLGKLIRISFPLILNQGSVVTMVFVDRMFLSWYGTNEISAIWPAHYLYMALMAVFYSITTFVNVFVAQYYGAGNKKMCSAAVWQGFYFTLMAYVVLLMLIIPGRQIFSLFGHRPEIANLERIYFTIMVSASVMPIMNNVVAGFFTGRGQSKITMTANIIGNALNICLDYLLIFGHFGLPRMGIAGAALATAISSMVAPAIMFSLFLSRKYQEEYATRQAFKFRSKMVLRMLKIGAPSSLQDLSTLVSMWLFFMFIARCKPESLAANNIAWSINDLMSIYQHGIALGVLTLCAQYLGADKDDDAQKMVYLGAKIMLTLCSVIALIYFVFGSQLSYLFRPHESGGETVPFALVQPRVKLVLFYLIIFNFLHQLGFIFKESLRAAHDTNYFLKTALIIGVGIYIPGIFAVSKFAGDNVNYYWVFLLCVWLVMFLAFFTRYRGGHWRHTDLGDLNEEA